MSREYVLQPFRAPVDLRIDYAAELNPQQHAAVTAEPGPALVIAGAGSGKTRTLTYRVAFLLEQGIPPERILLLTFTNKAAKEMMRRVAELLGQPMPGLWGGTFHSIGNRILRQHARTLGFERDFSILDRDDAKEMIDACIADVRADPKEKFFPKADVLGDLFSLATNKCISVEELIRQEQEQFEKISGDIARVQQRYVERKRAANSMDFDDLLVLWLKLMREDADTRDYYQRRFQFILVDEYQDTNMLQGELIDLLAARHHNVMVVGDDAQSIYAWRGANYENILKFPERHPGAKVYKIETNYRSSPEILQVANAAIAANIRQFEKKLAPARQTGPRPVLVACEDAHQQSTFVAQRMLELREEGCSLNQMAVLYRSHFHALELQLELTRRDIPFSITSGIRFFEQAHIKDVAAYLKLIVNPRDEMAFKRLVKMLPGVGGKSAEKLWGKYSAALPTSAPAEREVVARAVQSAAEAVPKKAKVAWAQFAATMAQLETAKQRPEKLIELVIDAGYDEYLKSAFTNHRSRLEDIEQLSVFARQFDTPEDFLAQLALLTNVEAESQQTAEDDSEKVRLTTIHQAKGLEFDVVFVIMLCDGLFPSARSVQTEEGGEEERRLFYVAITRARNELHLCYPRVRALAGGGDALQRPSRFLAEIPTELVEELSLRTYSLF